MDQSPWFDTPDLFDQHLCGLAVVVLQQLAEPLSNSYRSMPWVIAPQSLPPNNKKYEPWRDGMQDMERAMVGPSSPRTWCV